MTTTETSLETALTDALDTREATAFVHAGSARDPAIRYCDSTLETGRHAVAFDGREWYLHSGDSTSAHPADALASRLADHEISGTVLTPARIPHDAALYLEQAGFFLASSDVIARTRATKTPDERDRITTAQAAASAGIRRAASLLAEATTTDGQLAIDGDVLTPASLRRAIDEAIVSAGAFPTGNTAINPETATETLRPGDPIVLAVAPRDPEGYYGGLVRTLVVDGDGGRERRAHVAVTQAFRSATSMLTADAQSVTAVEADLEAEVRAFGFDENDGIETRVTGVGLDPHERPHRGDHEVGSGTLVRLDVGVAVDDHCRLRLADVFTVDSDEVRRLKSPSQSLDPAALFD